MLGAVAPAVGEANSWFFHSGRGTYWKMSDRLHEEMYRQVYSDAGVDPEDVEADTELMLDAQFDHALMAVAVARWTPQEKESGLPESAKAR